MTDSIMRDIHRARDDGHFDERQQLGPSELERTSVEELLERVAMMSPATRREYLATVGRVRTDELAEVGIQWIGREPEGTR